jgi:capsular exopolysaccharide synthesis family protein
MSDSIQKHDDGQNKNGLGKFEFVPTYTVSDPNSGAGNPLDPKKIVLLLLRYKWIVLLLVLTGGIGAWFYADTIDPTYESNGTLLISAGSSGDDELSRIISQTTGVGTSSTLANELQVIQSREFARQVAVKIIDENPGDITEFPVLYSVDEEGNVSRASEEGVTGRIRRNLSAVRPVRDTDIIELSFASSSPIEAAHVVNTAMEIYVDRSTMLNRQAAELTAEFLEEERQDIQQKLADSEQRLKNYMDRTGIVRMDEQSSAMVNQQTSVEMEIQQVSLELQSVNQAIENHEQQMERLKPGLAEQFSEAIGPRIRNSQEQLARYEGERTMILTRNPGVRDRELTPPRLKYLDEEIERVKDEIRDLSSQLFSEEEEYMGLDSEERAQMVATIQTRLTELRIQQSQYQSRVETLRQRKQEIEQSFDQLPEGMMELARLQRDVAINEELFVNVSKQYADMSVLKQSQFGFGRILDTAMVPSVPVSPNKTLLLLIGIMLGGLISAGFIGLREFMDKSMNSVDMIKSMHYPLLSAVPAVKKISKRKRKRFSKGSGTVPNELVLFQDRSSIASESIRRLKNNIVYQFGHTPPKTIAVTSSEKGDGKSTIVSNLGIAFAEDGFKTLIVDADFRRPRLHHLLGLKNDSGLTDYLDDNLKLVELFKDTDYSHLKLVSAGTKLDRPESVVSTKQFREFLKKMEDVFDVIILDTPPFGIISDSAALLKIAEATLVVTRYRKTNRGVFVNTIEELERINANVTGIVLNSFDHRKETGTNYGPGYYKALYSSYEAYAD